ncbi:MAG: AAA family ATPase [Dehalococcoidia bacterium]|nr:AAA family ATPase [Dehalococcoidia bacterium]
MQVFDEGRLTDSKGRTADARNTVVVMTSNIASDKQMGFRYQDTEEAKTAMLHELRKRFRAEFINRIDEQVVFRTLAEADVRSILRPMLDQICDDLREQHKVTLQVGEEAEGVLARAGYSADYGVRELRRTVERLIQVPLSGLILGGKLKRYSVWQVVCGAEGLSILPAGGETL